MKILVLSDIHYPLTDRDRLAAVISQEKADKTVFLGDNVEDEACAEEFLQFLADIGCRNYVLIKGDNELSLPYEKSLELAVQGRSFTFVHGYQFNIRDDRATGRIASALKKLNKKLPVLAYAVFSKIRSRTTGYLILGHAHALEFFPKLKVAIAGCLTTDKNIYNDRGYIVIFADDKGVTLTLRPLEGRDRVFEI
jgi:putative phosphoesterase